MKKYPDGILRCSNHTILSLRFIHIETELEKLAVENISEFESASLFLLSGNSVGELILWDVEIRRPLFVVSNAHSNGITEINYFFAFGMLIISTQGRDGKIKFWEICESGIKETWFYKNNLLHFEKVDILVEKTEFSVRTYAFGIAGEELDIVGNVFEITRSSATNSLSFKLISERVIDFPEDCEMIMQATFIQKFEVAVILMECGKIFLVDKNFDIIANGKFSLSTHFEFSLKSPKEGTFLGAVSTSTSKINGFKIKFIGNSVTLTCLPEPLLMNEKLDNSLFSSEAFRSKAVERSSTTSKDSNGSSCLQFSGKALVIGGWENSLNFFHQQSLTPITTIKYHKDSIHRLTVSPDDEMLAVAGCDGEISLWKLSNLL